jgi:hypothetical protein
MFFGGKHVRGVRGEQGEQKAVDLPPWTRDCLPSNGVFYFFISFFKKDAPACNCLCEQNKKNSLCRLKINHALGLETCICSWYTGPYGSEHAGFM